MSIPSIQDNTYINRDYAAEASSHSFKGMCWRVSEIAMKVMAFVLPVAAVVLSAIFYPTGLPLISLAAFFGCFKLWDWGVSLGKSADWHSVKHQLTSTIAQEIIFLQNNPEHVKNLIHGNDGIHKIHEAAKVQANLKAHGEKMYPLLAQYAIALKTGAQCEANYAKAKGWEISLEDAQKMQEDLKQQKASLLAVDVLTLDDVSKANHNARLKHNEAELKKVSDRLADTTSLCRLNEVDLSKLDDAGKAKHNEKVREVVDTLTFLKFNEEVARVEETFFAFLAANPTSKWTLSGDHDASDSYQIRESRRDTDLIRLNTRGNLRYNEGIISLTFHDVTTPSETPGERPNCNWKALNQIIEAFGAQFLTLPTTKQVLPLGQFHHSTSFYTDLQFAAKTPA